MKKRFTKILALVMGIALVGSGIGVTAYATNSENQKGKEESGQETETASAGQVQEKAPEKDETVYVFTGADGSVENIIVSDWLKNTLGSDVLTDESKLTDIVNVKGDEAYTRDGDSKYVWQADGSDIYYQGKIEKELPVDLTVSYKLNGKSVSAQELAGKSGEVTIRFDYKNNQYQMTEVNGQQEKVYVPFAMLTGMILDNEIFTNVEVTNGRMINDGTRQVVVGMAFPGLADNLKLDTDTLIIPDYVEITAQTKGFAMGNTMTLATNQVFSELDTEELNTTEDLSAALGELTDAMSQLMDGSSELYEGLCTLLDKSGELISGINRLSDGLGQLAANSDTLNAGSKQVFESLLAMADSQMAEAGLTVPKLTIDNYTEVLNQVISSLDSDKVAAQAQAVAREKVTAQVNAQADTVRAAVTEAVKAQVTEQVTEAVRDNVMDQVLAAAGLDRESYQAGIEAGLISEEQQEQINGAVKAQMAGEQVQALLKSNVESQMQSGDIAALIEAKTQEQIAILIEQNMNSSAVQDQITKALEQAKSGAASISALKGQLDGYREFYNGLKQYTQGVGQACDGASAMKQQAPQLTDGITRLRDGAKELSEGLVTFNEEGIQKLTEAVDGDIEGLLERVKATVEVSKEYRAFASDSEETLGQVKFIYRTEAVE